MRVGLYSLFVLRSLAMILIDTFIYLYNSDFQTVNLFESDQCYRIVQFAWNN